MTRQDAKRAQEVVACKTCFVPRKGAIDARDDDFSPLEIAEFERWTGVGG